MKDNKIRKIIKEKVSQNQDATNKSIAELILKEYPEYSDFYSIQALAYHVMESKNTSMSELMDSDTVDTSNIEEQSERYTIDGDTCFYKVKGSERKISIAELDKMFYAYSKFGENLSQDEMIRRFKFPRGYWGGFKAVFNLNKNSNTFSEITGQQLTPIEYKERVETHMNDRLGNIEDVVIREYESSLVKGYEKMVKSYAKHKLGGDAFLDELAQLVPSRRVINVNVLPKEYCKQKWVKINIADLHIGLTVQGLKMTPDFNIPILVDRLDKIAYDINKDCAEYVELSILGDIIESYTGMNHPTTFKNMTMGKYDANLVMESYKILIDFFNKINNLKKVNILPGNHDRATPDKKQDPNGSIGVLIGEFIKLFYADKMTVEVHDLYIESWIDNIQMLDWHGDKFTFKKGTSDKRVVAQILDYVNSKASKTIISSGHLHRADIRVFQKNILDIVTPAVTSGADYSEGGGMHSPWGYTKIRPVEGGTVSFENILFN